MRRRKKGLKNPALERCEGNVAYGKARLDREEVNLAVSPLDRPTNPKNHRDV